MIKINYGENMFQDKKLFVVSFLGLILIVLSKDIISHEISYVTKQKLNLFAQRAYSTLPTIYNTYELAVRIIKNKIPGDFIECGVAAGSQVAAMALACQQFNVSKQIHLFDSFEGIPLASSNDTDQPGIGEIKHNTNVADLNELLVTTGVSACSVERVKNHMQAWGIDAKRLIYHKGWFQHTLPLDALSIKRISFLRLDGDLYESTKVCLEYLYPKMSKGGYVVIDDFALDGCRKAVLEYIAANDLNIEIIEIVGGLGPVYWQVK